MSSVSPTAEPTVQSAETESNQRNSVRFESKLKVIPMRDRYGERCDAIVLNESFGGLGLEVDVRHASSVGSEVELDYNGTKMWARIQNCRPTEDGRVRLGMAWKAVSIATEARKVCESAASRVDDQKKGPPDPEHLMSFIKMLPGGLYQIWNLLERNKWHELDEAVERVACSARRCGFGDVVKGAADLRSALRQGVRVGELRTWIDLLIRHALTAVAVD